MPELSQPARPELHQHTDFFRNARNFEVHSSTFTSVSGTKVHKDGFQILQDHVAPAAFHNSKQRVDPPRCHPRTREAVLEGLFDWIVASMPRKAWITWLNGAAGAGKSAICQSLAEMCVERGVKVASFFFFHTDATRNTVDPVIATLAYQIIQLLPETKDLIVQAIESHPLIFEQTLAAQLEVLIVTPIRRLQIPDTSLVLLLILDGVDECTGPSVQMSLIHTFAELLQKRDLPLIILFGSRCETQIQMAFNAQDMDGILKRLPLDYNYQAVEDIKRFLVERFDDIKRTHPLGRRLETAWPAAEHVQQIVQKSSGQFVYAAVVIKFVSMPSSNPSTQLDIVCGLRLAGRATPFAELDVLYRHIFSHMDDSATALGIIVYAIVVPSYHMREIFSFFGITEDDGESILAPLASVLSCNMDHGKIIFDHASLPDFLWDKERSREYCISNICADLATLWFKNAASGCYKDLSIYSVEDQILDVVQFLYNAKARPDLRAMILEYIPSQTPSLYAWSAAPMVVLKHIRQIDFGDDGEVYRTVSDRMVRYVTKEFPRSLSYLKMEFTTLPQEEIHQPAETSTPAKSSIWSRLSASLQWYGGSSG